MQARIQALAYPPLSDPYFVNRFSQTQQELQKPLVHQYVIIPSRFANSNTLVLTMSSEPPPHLEASPLSSIFSVIPCLRSSNYSDNGHKLYVEATCDDLVLCTQETHRPSVYYICNSYTKEWIRLPPTPRGHRTDLVKAAGLICELNAEYRYRVVRLITNYAETSLFVEIFSFETGEWREYCLSRILDQRRQRCILSPLPVKSPGIACNGKLYWLTTEGSVFELDAFNMCGATSDAGVTDKCRFIDPPTLPIPDMHVSCWHIGVCRGHLQMCPEYYEYGEPMVIWELKDKGDGKPEWYLLYEITNLSEMVPKQFSFVSWFQIVGFHPVHKDVVYLHDDESRYVFMCNVREKTFAIATKIPSEKNDPENPCIQIVPYMIPWWPTPVPTRSNFREENLNVTVTVIGTGVDDTFALKVGSFSSVKQLKQEIEEKRGNRELDRELHCDGKVLDDDDKSLGDYGIKDNSYITLERPYPFHRWSLPADFY